MKTVRFSVVLVAALALAQVMAAAEGPSGQPPLPPPLRTAPASGKRPAVLGAPVRLADSGTPPAVAAIPGTLAPAPSNVLSFDATTKRVDLAEGETNASFVFAVTNISKEPVTISYVNTSCGCTAGKLPSYPWVLKPGEGGYVDVTVNTTGKFGQITKTATIVSSAGSFPLTVGVNIPAAAPSAMDRTRNVQLAAADRQAVFRNDCANCHVQPTLGKHGKELYDTACGICHEAEHRASMVPDLRTRLKNTDRNYWAKWISDGRQGSLMPAFLAKNGGILNEDQVASLVEYLEVDYKQNPPPSKYVPVPAPASLAPAPTTVTPVAK